MCHAYVCPDLTVACVQVIFNLPKHLGTFPHPLAYVHWYRPLNKVDPITSMYPITPATCQRQPYAQVISIDQFYQGCMLIPQSNSKDMPASWENGEVLDLASKFFLNKYTDIFHEYVKST